MRRTTIFLSGIFAALAGCASHRGWMEGPRVDDEVRRVLASDTGGEMGIAANGGLYLVPPGALKPERRALLAALGRSESIRFQRVPPVLTSVAEPARTAPQPRWDQSIHAWTTPDVIEIRYSDCTCRLRRLDLGDGIGAYTVDLADRQAGGDRGYTYRMKLRSSESLDGAWDGLVSAVERGVAYRHYGGVASASPIDALREVGIDSRGLSRDMTLRTPD